MENISNNNSIFNDKIISKLSEVSENKNDIRLSAAISKKGEREYRLWGAEGELPFQKYSYEIGSITKTFTGLLVAKAIDLGKADFNDNVSLWIPEIPNNINLPAIGQLVTHCAGFPFDEDDFEDIISAEAINPYANITRADLIESIKEMKHIDEDHSPAYSNFGAALAGLLAERIFEKSYKELMHELFSELGLTDTIVYLNENTGLYGYDKSGNKHDNWRWFETSAYAPAGSLVSTASDLLNYGEAIIKNDKQYITLAAKPLALFQNNGVRAEIGCFWFYLPDYQLLYHNGTTGDFNAALAIDMEEKNVMTILSNRLMPDDGSFILSLLLSMRER